MIERARYLLSVLAGAALLSLTLPASAEDTSACVAGGEAWRAGENQAAIDHFTACIDDGDLEPASMASALASRGNVLRVSGATVHSIPDFNAALAIDADHVGALFGRANAWFGLHDLRKALADFDHVIAIMPSLAQAYFGRANVHTALEDYTSAIADYDQSLALDPADPFALTNRGWAKLSAGDIEAAMADFDAAITIKDDHVLAYINRAWAYYLKGDFAGGIPDAEHAISLAPDRVPTHATLGQLQIALGQRESALGSFERAMELGGSAIVQTYQRRLANKGYDPGPADGGYGTRTRQALVACIADACRLL